MVVDGEVKGGIVIYSEMKLPQDEFEVIKTLANDLAYAIKSISVEKEKAKAMEQIEKNIEICYLGRPNKESSLNHSRIG